MSYLYDEDKDWPKLMMLAPVLLLLSVPLCDGPIGHRDECDVIPDGMSIGWVRGPAIYSRPEQRRIARARLRFLSGKAQLRIHDVRWTEEDERLWKGGA